jgi:hypothetical protein
MFLKAWKMSDDTVVIHDPKCGHRKPAKSGRGLTYTAVVADGKSEYLSKEAFAKDYWKAQELTVLDPFQGLSFMPCCDELPVQEPQPAKRAKGKTPTAPRVTGHKQWSSKAITPVMAGFTAWIAREFPELKVKADDEKMIRLVTIASKAYNFYQKSDLNPNNETTDAA